MSEPRSQPPSENSLAFGGAFAGVQTLFGCRSSRFRIGKFALGLALRVLRILGLRLCLFRFLLARPASSFARFRSVSMSASLRCVNAADAFAFWASVRAV